MPDETETPETEAPEAAAPAAAPPSSSPWSTDLASLVPDDAAREQVDRYLRETWQPRVTKLEQQYAETEAARALHNDFVNDPHNTYLQVGQQLFGEDFAGQLQPLFNEEGEETPVAETAATPAELDPRVKQMLDDYETQQQQNAYQQLLTKTKAENPEVVDDLFHPFVISADGDFDVAVQNYKGWLSAAQAHTGQPGEAAAAPPPATLGTDVDGTTPVPIEPKYDSLDAALDDTLAEMKANRVAATVGSV